MALKIKPPTHKVDAGGVFVSPFDSAWDSERLDRELAALELAALEKLRSESLDKAAAAASGRELSEEEIEDVKSSCVLSEVESQAARLVHPWFRYLGGLTRFQLDAPDWDHEGKPATARDYLKGKPDAEFVLRRMSYRTYLECQDETGHERMLAFVRHGLKAIRSADYSWTAKADETTPDDVFEALHQTSLSLTGEIAVAVMRFNAPLSEAEKSRAA